MPSIVKLNARLEKIPLPSHTAKRLSRGRTDRLAFKRGTTRVAIYIRNKKCEGGVTPPSIPPSRTSMVRIISYDPNSLVLVSSVWPCSLWAITARPSSDKISNYYNLTTPQVYAFYCRHNSDIKLFYQNKTGTYNILVNILSVAMTLFSDKYRQIIKIFPTTFSSSTRNKIRCLML